MGLSPLMIERLRSALAGRYAVEREIGSGGMASVLLAEDLRHHRKVAIKVLLPELGAMIGPERFIREIELTAALHHPNILPLFDSGQADGLLFYVMPHVEGETLRDRLRREGRLSVDDAIQLAEEISAALDFAHRRGVVHRDVKPENILLQDDRAIVADFGIALSEAASERVTATGMSVGTPHYMSPEQALGQREIDGRTDVYALGAILYEMLTGAPPFTGSNAQAIVAKVLTEKPVPPAKLRPEVPAQVSHAVVRALQKNADDRFPTAGAFRAAFSGSAAPAPRRSRRRWPLVVAGSVLLAIAGAIAAYVWHHSAAPPAAEGGAAVPARRIAVVPFRNANGDTENTSFSEGLTLELNDALSRVPGLTIVVASSAKYRAADFDIAAAGRELGVDAVLTGRVDTASGVVRVQVQLQDTRTRALSWSDKYDRKLRDLYSLEDTLAAAIAADLQLATNGSLAARGAVRRTASPEAHALLVEARGRAERRTGEALAAAVALYTAAINIDSSYALAWAGRANTRVLMVAYGVAPVRSLPVAMTDARHAIELDTTVAGAYAALGFAHLMYDHDWPAAGAQFARAVTLDSTAAQVRLFRGWYFVAMDQFDSAAASMRAAIRLDPAAPINDTRLGTVLFLADDVAGADSALANALRKDPASAFARTQRAQLYAATGRCADALRLLPPNAARNNAAYEIAYTLARCGITADARRFLADREAEFRAGQDVDGFWLARVYAALGDDAKVFQWLNRAVQEPAWALFMLRRDPAFKSYRSQPRFQQLVRQVYGA